MRFHITLTGETEFIPKLYAAVLALVETMDAVPGVEINSVEVEEQKEPVNWYQYPTLTETMYKGTDQPSTGVPNT